MGAAIGAGVGWGTGAAIGAGARALVGIVGVLVTRGHPTILGPETLLTFRIDQPVTISTEHAPYAFRFVNETDYQTQQPRLQARPGPPPPGAGYYAPGYAGYPYAYPYPYAFPYYPYYWGAPGIYLGFGGFYGRGFYGRGFYGRGFPSLNKFLPQHQRPGSKIPGHFFTLDIMPSGQETPRPSAWIGFWRSVRRFQSDKLDTKLALRKL